MDVKTVTKKALRALGEAKVPYMIVGGLAANYFGFPRATIDMDLAVKLEGEGADRLVRAVKKARFEISEPEVKKIVEVGDRFVMTYPKSGYRVDFWLAKTDYEKEALERRHQVQIFGVRTWACSPEDLILTKLDAGRGKDLDDALGVLHRQKGKLDLKYLKLQAERLGVSRSLSELQGKAASG